MSGATILAGEYLATVAIMAIVQVKVTASTKEELDSKLREKLTVDGNAWKLDEFAVKEASVQVTPLTGQRILPVAVKAINPGYKLSADRANVVAAS